MENRDAADIPAWRQQLGRVGVWVPGGAVDEDPASYANLVEQLGYTALWLGGGNPDATAFSRVEALLSASERLVIATGITNIWAWEPAELATRSARLSAAYPNRLVLGLGVSHASLVERLGRQYERPYSTMVTFLDEVDLAAETGPPRVLAALGPRMLRLSATRAAGAHPYLTTPTHTRESRSTLGTSPLLAPEQAIVLSEDPGTAREIARTYLGRYLGQPNYTANLRRLGWRDTDFEQGGSDALVDALVVHGGAEAVSSAIRAHFDAGADHVSIQPLGAGGSIDWGTLEALARVPLR